MYKLFRCLLLIGLSLSIIQAPALAASDRALYVFGDSLSDTGNTLAYTTALFAATPGLPPDFPAIPPSVNPRRNYFQGRFSNGPVAIEYLWKALQLNLLAQVRPSLGANHLTDKAISYAYGGAGTGYEDLTPGGFPLPGTLGQINAFLADFGGTAPSQALYVVWSGANDYLVRFASPVDVIANITQAINTLYSAGARRILVPNLPDLGRLPILNDPSIHYYPPGSSAALTGLTRDHNTALASALKTIRLAHPDITLIPVDIFALFGRLGNVLNTGMGPGGDCLFTDPTLGGGPYSCANVALLAPGYLYWDVEHPTSAVHQLISFEMLRNLVLR